MDDAGVSYLQVEHNVAVHMGEVKDECASALGKGYSPGFQCRYRVT